jgi:hypothetical protein
MSFYDPDNKAVLRRPLEPGHGGSIRISGRAPDRLVFEMPLGRFASGDLRVATG